MKTLYLFSVGVLTTLFAAGTASHPVQAQTSASSQPKIDSVFLSERIEGDMRIRSYRVEETDDSDYSVLYRINLAKLSTQLGRNSRELQDLDLFLRSLGKDSTRRVRQISVTGYSSPDGPHPFNERLAKARTNDFVSYAEKKYGLTDRFRVKTSSVAEDWESCRTMVAQSSMPDRDAVLKIIDDSRLSADQKEIRLKQMPAAWEYLKAHILPPLRRVEAVVSYNQGKIVEVRTHIPKPKPEPKPVVAEKRCGDPCGECLVVDEGITGFLVEYPAER